MGVSFDRLDDLAAAGDFDGLEHAALELLGSAAGGDAVDLWGYLAWSRLEQTRYRAALEAARAAGDPLYLAEAHFFLWEFEEAARALEGYEPPDAGNAAAAEWFRGLLAEFGGEDGTTHFERAARLAPGEYDVPATLADEEIDRVVCEAVASLPVEVRTIVEETAIEVRDLPRPAPDTDPLMLGLYVGRDRLERSLIDGPELPPRIEIYRRNIERLAADRADAIDELRITLLHEIAHHLGFGEPDMGRMGLA